jgi:hypothetical protein
LDLSTFLIVLSGKNKKNGFYFSDKRSIVTFCIKGPFLVLLPFQTTLNKVEKLPMFKSFELDGILLGYVFILEILKY